MLKSNLTEREIEVCQGISRGKSNYEISKELVISKSTVKTHVHNLLQKLGLKSRYQVVLLWEGGENFKSDSINTSKVDGIKKD